MSELRRCIFALSAMAFAVLYLGSIIVLGHPVARTVAIAVALLGVFSQFVAQDDAPAARAAHFVATYIGFVLALVALVVFIVEG